MHLLLALGLGYLDPKGGRGQLGSAGLLAVDANQGSRWPGNQVRGDRQTTHGLLLNVWQITLAVFGMLVETSRSSERKRRIYIYARMYEACMLNTGIFFEIMFARVYSLPFPPLILPGRRAIKIVANAVYKHLNDGRVHIFT